MPAMQAKARRSPRLIAALLLTSALGAAFVEVDANWQARSALQRIVAAHPGLQVERVTVEPFSGAVSLHGVATRIGDAHIAIGTLHLAARAGGFGLVTPAMASPFDDAPADTPAPKPEAPAAKPAAPEAPAPVAQAPMSMGATSADNVVIVSGATTYRIKRIDMTGTALTNADLKALLDVNSTESAEARLKKFSAAAVVIPELLADKKDANGEQHMSMTHILLANVNAGMVAAGSAGEISFSIQDKGTTNGTTGSVEAVAVDLAQIAHVFGSVRTDEAEPIRPLYEAFVVNSIKLDNVTEKSTFSIGKLKEVGAKGRALKTDIASASSAAAKADPSDRKSALLFDDMAHSFEIGLLEMTDVAAQTTDPQGLTTFGFASASMKDFANRGVGGLDLAGFHVQGPDLKVGVGAVSIGAFGIPQTAASSAPGAPASTLTPPSTIDIKTVDVDMIIKDAATAEKPASSKPLKFTVEHIGFAGGGPVDAIPPKTSMSIEKVAFDVPPDDASGFYDMGYKHVSVSAGLATTYDAASQDLSIDKFSIEGADMGAIGTRIHLINVGKGLLSSDKDVQTSSMIAILLRDIDLKVKNDGLFEKAIAEKAKKDGMTVAQERDLGIDFFQNKLPTVVNNNEKAKLVGQAIAKFIADPKTLHIAIASKSGLGVAAMGMLNSPELILDTLSVQATANE